MDYRVSASSPTAELFTLGQIFYEVGGYASSIFDRSHLSMARKCASRLKKVVGELVSRNCIQSAEDLHRMPECFAKTTDLSAMTIDELHSLYRQRTARQNERAAEGREILTYYYERQIVREMQRRKANGQEEQLKIDYCAVTYGNELENLSAILSLPVKTDSKKTYPDRSRHYTPDDLWAHIAQHRSYRDVTEREIFVEYVDIALDQIEQTDDLQPYLGVIAEIVEIGRERIIRVPGWLTQKLEEALAQPSGKDSDRAAAMLTLQMINGDPALERKAARLINRRYRAAFDETLPIQARTDALHTAVTCSTYVTRYSPRKAATAYRSLSATSPLPAKPALQLLDIANQLAQSCQHY